MERMHHLANRFLLPLICIAYTVGALLPSLGILTKTTHLGSINWLGGSHMVWTVQAVLLATLLFNASLGVSFKDIAAHCLRPKVILLGLIANALVPAAVIVLLGLVLTRWQNQAQAQALLMGLALVVSMPIAGSSTAWAQNSGGNVAVSLGLVLFSTLLSPVITPGVLATISNYLPTGTESFFATTKSNDLGAFLTFVIVLPTLAGSLVHHIFGEVKIHKIRPHLKMLSICILLFLNYANAAIALPKMLDQPDFGFVALTSVVTLSFCGILFYVGWNVPKLATASKSTRISMMYGLGMNNNGTALVIAATVMPMKPMILVPIIIYNLGQHIVAGLARLIIQNEEEVEQNQNSMQQENSKSAVISIVQFEPRERLLFSYKEQIKAKN